jgi:hypothetical protein
MVDNVTTAHLCSDVGVPVIGFRGCSIQVRGMCSTLAVLGGDDSAFALSKGRGNQHPDMTTGGNRFRSLLGGQTTDYED